ncbi:MAG: GNAT family N-acetyltransferase [Chloroflexi bacterium]|nr:GNAT family N-acetyltransferase [Chloroflexota bacterium]
MPTFYSPKVVCRPALPLDTADVLEFTKFIWDGRDYVPYVWNHWLKDPHGILAVAEYGGHAIGLAKVTLLAPGQWWLEGFRVNPKYQGLKVGSHIHEYVDDWWMQNGDGVARLMTNAKNLPVHHLCEKLGFHKTGEMVGFVAEPLEENVESFSPVVNLKEAANFALESESIKIAGGMSDFGWRVMQPNESALQKFTTPGTDFEHTAFWWHDHQALITTWDDDDDGEPVLGVGLAACEIKDMPALLMDARRLAGQKNCKNVFWIAYSDERIFVSLAEAGYERKWENAGFIFEKARVIARSVRRGEAIPG